MYICDNIAQLFMEWETFQIKFVEKIKKKHFMFLSFSKNRAVYEDK